MHPKYKLPRCIFSQWSIYVRYNLYYSHNSKVTAFFNKRSWM